MAASLGARVTDSLRDEILDRNLKSGDILLEKEIAARFEVSKTPVREALAMLCQEGLVQLFPRRGYVVRGLTLQDVLDTFDMRVVLEGAAAERAARHLSEDEFETLAGLAEHDCCGASGQLVSHQLEAMRHSLDFHLVIARGSRNAQLAAEIEKLLRASRRITSIGFTYGHHLGIVAALRSRDAAASRRAMEDHIQAGRDLALRTLADGDGAFR